MTCLKSSQSIFVAIVLWGAVSVAPAWGQSQSVEVSAVIDRIESLERELRDLQLATYQSSGQTSTGAYDPSTGAVQPAASGDPTMSRILVRLDQLEGEIRSLTGQIEELNFKIQQANQEIASLSEDSDFRFRALETGDVTPRVQSSDASQPAQAAQPQFEQRSSPTPITGVTGDFQTDYKSAFSLLKSSDFEQAEASFKQFLAEYGDTELASNAQYWLGETYYHRNMHREGAQAFLDCVRNYPDGKKAADCMLKLGMSLSALGKTQEACTTLTEVPRRYPRAADNIKAKAQEERSKLSCS